MIKTNDYNYFVLNKCHINIYEHRLAIWGLNDIDIKYVINDVKSESTLPTC